MSGLSDNPAAEDSLARRMAALGVLETDLREAFVRSGGHGGQNINKTSTCVMLVHAPTGLQVKCQATRHQGRNRLLARALLLDKIESLRDSQAAALREERERIRRQKRGRSHGAKLRLLADKARHAAKKRSRHLVERE